MERNRDIRFNLSSKRRTVGYWTTTCLLCLVFFKGAINDLLKQPPYFDMLLKFGYPGYFSIVIGGWKILGVFAVLLPGLPRIKEWAYAGFFILLTCALATRIATNEPGIGWLFDLIFIGITICSWALRPPSRVLPGATL